MIGVSKTFGGSSILSSPAQKMAGTLVKSSVPVFSFLWKKQKGTERELKHKSMRGNQQQFPPERR